MLFHHVIVNILAALNLGHEVLASFSKVSYTPAHKTLPPLMLHIVTSPWSLARADGDKHAHIPAGPLVDGRLVEGLWRWIELAAAFVDVDRLSDLDWLESETSGSGGAPCLPDGAVRFGSGFFSRIVGAKESSGAIARAVFVNGCYRAD